MTRTIFVTGTDTGVGKTMVSAALLAAATERGLVARAYKPDGFPTPVPPPGSEAEPPAGEPG